MVNQKSNWLYIVWVIVEVLLILCSVALWLVAPEYTVLNICVTVFTILLGAILFYPRRTDMVTWLGSREGRNTFTHATTFFLYFCIASMFCYLSWKFPWQKDMTERSLNTLSQQSIKIVELLPKNTTITLYAKRQNWGRALSLLRLYRDVRNDIEISAIDPETNPQKARSAGVQAEGTIVVEAAGKRSIFVLNDELSVTNSLLKMIRERAIKVYFTWGHGEATCEDTAPEGISAFCKHLQEQQYQFARLDLQTQKDIPADADLVVIFGPTGGFLPQEIQRIQIWLEKGGSLALFYSPMFDNDSIADLRTLAKKWGLIAHNNLVIDRVSTLETQEATIPLITQYDRNHPVTRGFSSRTLFPLSSSVSLAEPLYQGVATTSLALTSSYPSSWGESDLKGISQGKASFDAKTDIKGPVSVVGVAERLTEKPGEKDTRFAVIANDVFIRNAYQNQTANMNLMLNLFGWLSHDEGIVSLNRPGLHHDPVVLSAPHLRMVFVITVITVPLLAFVFALLVYRKRRRL
ncbi:MAG: GldG family protein [Bacteriovoracaceae bacterium]|nr:GldG family protein [Bacteriovoracaceae bacterium]